MPPRVLWGVRAVGLCLDSFLYYFEENLMNKVE